MANLPLFAMRNHIRPAVGIPHMSLSQHRECHGRDGGRSLRRTWLQPPLGGLRLIHRKANSDRIMGRLTGNGAVPTPERTMIPSDSTLGKRGRTRWGLTAAPRTKEPNCID